MYWINKVFFMGYIKKLIQTFYENEKKVFCEVIKMSVNCNLLTANFNPAVFPR